MQCSLTILSSVAAPLTLFITSKLVILNIHERSCFRLQVARNISQRISAYHRACSALFAFNLGATRWEWEQVVERFDINKRHRIKEEKTRHFPGEIFVRLRISSTHDAPVSAISTKRYHCFSFHRPGLCFFPSAPVPHFFAISVVKYRGKYVALDLFAVEAASWCDHAPLSVFDDCYFFPRFAEKHKIRTRSLRSTRLVSRNKSGGHAAVRLWWLILFWRFAEEQNPRCIVSIHSGRQIKMERCGDSRFMKANFFIT